MPLPEHNIEREFALILLSLHLQKYPEQATILAMNHYEDYMNLAHDYKLLKRDLERLQQENFQLRVENTKIKSSTPSKSPQLPLFLEK